MLKNIVHLVIIKDNKVLLQKRQNTHDFSGYYALPGGKIEQGETAEEAGTREAKEELDIDVKECNVLGNTEMVIREDTYHNNFVHVSKYQGTAVNNEPHKCSELEYYPVTSLPETIIPFIKEGIELLVRNNAELLLSGSVEEILE